MGRLATLVVALLVGLSASAPGQDVQDLLRRLDASSGSRRLELIAELLDVHEQQLATVDGVLDLAGEALAALSASPRPELEVRVRLDLASICSRNGAVAEGLEHALVARALARVHLGPADVALADYQVALCAWRDNDHAEALTAAARALETQERTGDRGAMATTLTLMGAVHRSRSAYDDALACHLQALDLAEAEDDALAVARSRNNIGLIRWRMGDHERAYEDLLPAAATYRSLGEVSRLATASSNVGLILVELDRAAEALPHLEEALALHANLDDVRSLAKLNSNLGFAHERLGDLERALEHCMRSLALREGLGDTWGLARSSGQVAELLMRLGRVEPAMEHFLRGIAAAEEAGAREELSVLCGELAELYEDQARYADALAMFRRHEAAERELDRAEMSGRIAELEAGQVLSDHQRQLEQLELATTEQELELSLQRNRQTLLLAGLLVLFVTASGLLALAWWRSRALASIRASHEDLRAFSAKLAESELRYRTVFEDALVPKLLVDLTTRTILDANTPAAALCGRPAPALGGASVDDTVPEWLGVHVPAADGLSGESSRVEAWRDGEGERHAEVLVTPLDLSGRPCAVVTIRDVTVRHRLEEERIRVDKLESLGLLAGGIAHDFNNALAGVLGQISVARVRSRANPQLTRHLDDAEVAVQRAAHLTSQLLAFSRGGEPRRTLSDVRKLIWDSVNFTLSGSDVSVEFDLAHDLWAAEVDTAQFEQVVRNLVLNAAQSMEGTGGTRLAVGARNIPAGSPGSGSMDGPGVLLRVRDEGHGIPAEIREKVCDPYFSTRPGGTGLGLATVFAVVSRHGGWLEFESEPGQGTLVSVAFPACPSQRPEAAAAVAEVVGGTGRVLVMDDDPMVQEVYGAALPELGFEVEVVADGRQAIERYFAAAAAGRPFDMIVMDLTVPGGMGGKEAMGIIRDRDPEALGIVASGYCKDPVMSDFRAAGFAAALSKPFTMSGLGRLVQQVLADREPAQGARRRVSEVARLDPTGEPG